MTAYDAARYWRERGKTFEDEALHGGWWDVEDADKQVALIRRYEREFHAVTDLVAGLRFDSMLEIGCGFGRVGAAIMRNRPGVAYTGLDVSPEMLKGAEARIPDGRFIEADLRTWEPDETWDLVLGVGVLAHLRPAEAKRVVPRLLTWARRDIVTVDWDERGKKTGHQWAHDYRRFYGPGVERTSLGITALYHLARR